MQYVFVKHFISLKLLPSISTSTSAAAVACTLKLHSLRLLFAIVSLSGLVFAAPFCFNLVCCSRAWSVQAGGTALAGLAFTNMWCRALLLTLVQRLKVNPVAVNAGYKVGVTVRGAQL